MDTIQPLPPGGLSNRPRSAAGVSGPDPSDAQTVAATLRQARRDAGLSLRDLARRAHTSHPTVLAYESGAKVPSAAVFLRLLQACGYAVDIGLRPRVRERDGIPRGDELEAVLRLAEQFPVRLPRTLRYPKLPQ